MEEIWKDIPGFHGYQASNLGRIKYLAYNKIRITYGTICDNGYYIFNIKKNDKRQRCYVHQLILLAFIGRPNEGEECDHIDRNRLNNKIKNLRWVTRKVNALNKSAYSKSNYKGVYYRTRINKHGTHNIFSSIYVNNNNIYLGTFNTEEEAHKAYKQAFKKHYGYEWMG